MGPALGGGHGRYQGIYGLLSDNIVNLNIVLGDGSEIRVNEKNHPELFWGMKGAGHNFGIVTSFELKIHPRSPRLETWYYHNYIFTQDKLEPLFEELNRFQNNGTTPKLMAINEGIYTVDSTFADSEVSAVFLS